MWDISAGFPSQPSVTQRAAQRYTGITEVWKAVKVYLIAVHCIKAAKLANVHA